MQRPSRNKKKIIIGVTGSFGSGKSTVSAILRSYGAYLIDADKIARDVTKQGAGVYKKIVKAFGREILKENKAIDRRKLAGIVFDNNALLEKLNSLLHPEAIRRIKKEIKSARNKIVVLDAPLLVEAGLKKLVNKLIVVRIAKNIQIKRIQKKTSLNKEEILKIIKAQISLSDKVRLADFIIDNNGTIKNTKEQVGQIRRRLWRN